MNIFLKPLTVALVLLITCCDKPAEPLTVEQAAHAEQVQELLKTVRNGDIIVFESGHAYMVSKRNLNGGYFSLCSGLGSCLHPMRTDGWLSQEVARAHVSRIIPLSFDDRGYCEYFQQFSDNQGSDLCGMRETVPTFCNANSCTADQP